MNQDKTGEDKVMDVGRTFGKIVREYFPDANNDEVDFILWEKTGYPCFWETDDVEACLRKQLQEFKEVIE